MTWRVWFKSLVAAFISAFATAASGALMLPTVFTWDKTGLINVAKLGLLPAILAVLAFLKASPVADK